MNPNPLTPSARSVTTMHWQQQEADKATQTALENIGALTKEHNPANLTPEQVGADGWRLLNSDEIVSTDGILLNPTCESWDNDRWSGRGDLGIFSDLTYRTKLSPAELRKARGLEPKEEAIAAEEAEPSPEAMALALKFTSIIAQARLARQIDELVAKKTAEAMDDAASIDAFDEIAKLCGCPEWDYPGQLVRDVRALVEQIADLEKLLLATREALKPMIGGTYWLADEHVDAARHALNATPDSVRAKYVTAEELAACQRERDELKTKLKTANFPTQQATECGKCGVYKHTPWRDDEHGYGYVCATCLEVIFKEEIAPERDSLAARVKELEALKKLRNKHVEVLRELERVKEELSRVSNYLRIEKQTHQEWEDSLRAQLSAANEARDGAIRQMREVSEEWASAARAHDKAFNQILTDRDTLRRQLEEAHADKLEADATVERMREELEYGRKALANYGAAWQPQSLSIPRPTALREHDLALAERAWKAVRWTDGFSFEESAIYRELTKGEGK